MMIGVGLRQQRGHWDTTPSNAWGTVAVKRFARAYPERRDGITTAQLGQTQRMGATGRSATRRSRCLPRFRRPTPRSCSRPQRQPGALGDDLGARRGAADRARLRRLRVSRQVTFLERKAPDRISAGDVLKMRITVDAPVDRTWVVVEDPIPAGASIVSGGGGQSMPARRPRRTAATVAELYRARLDSWRGYYDWLPKGGRAVEYVLRINGSAASCCRRPGSRRCTRPKSTRRFPTGRWW
jgi:uncharacterized protein YfaS (alpha-2-macroglobulin family)